MRAVRLQQQQQSEQLSAEEWNRHRLGSQELQLMTFSSTLASFLGGQGRGRKKVSGDSIACGNVGENGCNDGQLRLKPTGHPGECRACTSIVTLRLPAAPACCSICDSQSKSRQRAHRGRTEPAL